MLIRKRWAMQDSDDAFDVIRHCLSTKRVLGDLRLCCMMCFITFML